jgi:hypothetical protein
LATLGNGSFIEDATLKELRRRLVDREAAQPLQGCEKFPRAFLNPGFRSKPWADIRQRFQRYSIFGCTLDFSTFCAKPPRIILLTPLIFVFYYSLQHWKGGD